MVFPSVKWAQQAPFTCRGVRGSPCCFATCSETPGRRAGCCRGLWGALVTHESLGGSLRPPRRPPEPPAHPRRKGRGRRGQEGIFFFFKEQFLAVLTRQPFLRRGLAAAPRSAGSAWIAPLAWWMAPASPVWEMQLYPCTYVCGVLGLGGAQGLVPALLGLPAATGAVPGQRHGRGVSCAGHIRV